MNSLFIHLQNQTCNSAPPNKTVMWSNPDLDPVEVKIRVDVWCSKTVHQLCHHLQLEFSTTVRENEVKVKRIFLIINIWFKWFFYFSAPCDDLICWQGSQNNNNNDSSKGKYDTATPNVEKMKSKLNELYAMVRKTHYHSMCTKEMRHYFEI